MTKSEAAVLLRDMIRIHHKLIEKNLENGGIVDENYINQRIEALELGAESLEIDVKYDLEYEKTREAADGCKRINSHSGEKQGQDFFTGKAGRESDSGDQKAEDDSE